MKTPSEVTLFVYLHYVKQGFCFLSQLRQGINWWDGGVGLRGLVLPVHNALSRFECRLCSLPPGHELSIALLWDVMPPAVRICKCMRIDNRSASPTFS